MPTYCYRNERTGKVIEEFFHMTDDIPDDFKKDGDTYFHDLGAEGVGVPCDANWPIECIGSGVNAAQAGELRAHFKKEGLNIQVSDDGNPIYTSAKQQREGLKSRGFINKSSFY